MKSAHLQVHEWLAVVIMIAGISFLAIITSYTNKSPAIASAIYSDGVEIIVKGAVLYPGLYRLPSEMTMREVLEISQVLPEADLRRFNLDRPVKRGRPINIPVREMIEIHIEGAVKKAITLQVPKGYKVEDLLKIIDFDENANTKVLQKKRKLKAGESILIPYLKS